MSENVDSVMCWNGEIISSLEPTITVADSSYLRGFGIFETMLGVGNQVPLLDRHYNRLAAAAQSFNIKRPTLVELKNSISRLLAASQVQSQWKRLRLTVSTVPEMGLNQPWFSGDGKTQWLITVESCVPPMPKPMTQVDINISPFRMHSKCPTSGVKTTSYLPNMLCRQAAAKDGFDEAILLNENDELIECCAANIFFADPIQLWTPEVSSGCLPGILRGLVLDIASELGIPVHKTRITLPMVEQASFAFLTSATTGIRPVRLIDGVANYTDGEEPPWWSELCDWVRGALHGTMPRQA